MKKAFCLLVVLMLAISSVLSACDFSTQQESTSGEQETKPAANLIFESWGDGTCSVRYDIFTPSVSEIVIPATSPDGDTVTHIAKNAFSFIGGNTSIKSITIPDSVESIGESAFYQCSGLTSIVIPDSVVSIGKQAFYTCEGLTNVTIPDGVEKIGDWAFFGCYSLTSINIPNSVTSIGAYAFANCTNLTDITIPGSVYQIPQGAFSNCTSLTNVTISENVEIIYDGAFADCKALTSITIPNTVKEFRHDVFSGCENLSNVVFMGTQEQWKRVNTYQSETLSKIPIIFSPTSSNPDAGDTETSKDGLTGSNGNDVDVESSPGLVFVSNGDGTCILFEYNPLACPDGIVVIPERSPDGDLVTSIEYGIFASTNIVSITIPDGVTEIYDSTFASCYELREVKITGNLTRIDDMAFTECTELTTVILPKSLTSIGYCAFLACDNLNDIYFTGTEEEWESISIESDNEPLQYAHIHYNYVPGE